MYGKVNETPLQDRLIFVVFGWCPDWLLVTNSPKQTIDEVVLYKIPLDSSVAILRHPKVFCISLGATGN